MKFPKYNIKSTTRQGEIKLLLFLSQRLLVAKRRQHQNSVVPFPLNTVDGGIILVLQPITTELGAPWIVCTMDVGETASSPVLCCCKSANDLINQS